VPKGWNLQTKFTVLIGGGFIAIFLLFIVLWYATRLPPHISPEWGGSYQTEPQGERTGGNEEQITASGSIRIDRREGAPSNYQQDRSDQPSHRSAGPTESAFAPKLSDFLLLFLTYCLAIVGYFQILRSEEHTRTIERAFIFGGPLFISQQPVLLGTPPLPGVIANADGTSSVKIVAQNFGRTPGIIKRVFVQFSLNEPMGDQPVYGTGQSHAPDLILQPNNPIYPIRQEPFSSQYTVSHYCFGYIEYIDMFRNIHTSRWCFRIFPGQARSELAGSAAYNEWD
jgi:hypothetical protein